MAAAGLGESNTGKVGPPEALSQPKRRQLGIHWSYIEATVWT